MRRVFDPTRRIAVTAVTLLVALSAPASAQRKIYLANDNHTDIFWNADLATYEDAFVSMIDYYLQKAQETSGEVAGIPAELPQFQSRFNLDGTNWLWTYQRRKTPAEFDALISKIKSGHFSVNMLPNVMNGGGMGAEAFIRGMLYAGQLERDHGLKFELAYMMENQTMPYGVASLFAGAGAKYSWHGICGCETKLADYAQPRDREIYWWQGQDGKRLLMKWYSFQGLGSLGGYAEARSVKPVLTNLQLLMDDTARYPYAIGGAFGYGGDDVNEERDRNQTFVQIAKRNTTPTTSIVVSNQVDFFKDFEATYGSSIPVFNASFGNEWDTLTASLQASSSQVRRAIDKLRNAEALSVLVTRKSPTFMDSRRAEQRQRWMDIGIYFDHGWTSRTDVYPDLKARRLAWTVELANGIDRYVNTLHEDASAALAQQIRRTGNNTRFYVFNALNWVRTDVADVPYSGPWPVHVVDLVTNVQVPAQPVTIGGVTHLRVMAPAIGSVGYKVFEIRSGPGSTVFGDPVSADALTRVIQNERYAITVGDNGNIVSIVDKTRGSREFVRPYAALPGGDAMTVNSFGPGTSAIEVENAGIVSKTFKIVSATPLQRTTRITLFRDSDRIDIQNEITQNFGDLREWGFSFNIDAPTVRHDEVGVVLTARLQTDGGHYATRQARYDWLTANRFVDVSGTNVGVTLSNPDLNFVKVGESTSAAFDTTRPVIRMLAGGRPDLDQFGKGFGNQGGATYFLQRFALQTHGAYNQSNAMRFALEHQTPLVARTVVGGNRYAEKSFSLFKTNTNRVMVTALKVPEDGISRGVIARVWNSNPANTTFSFSGSINAVEELTHIESFKAPRASVLSLKNQETATYLMR
jgi:alpha-mannosidase